MAPTSRPDFKMNLDGLGQMNINSQARSAGNSNANSPLDQPAGTGIRYPLANGLAGAGSQAGTGRAGAGSPSKEFSSRLFSKRAREIQQQEGLTPPIWGPPMSGSGHSTPLRETIPESPGSDNFPDFDNPPPIAHSASSTPPGSIRRARAGTVPSRFPGISSVNSSTTSLNNLKSSRPTSSASPYPPGLDPQANAGANSTAALLSRLRAGSMPQRSGYLGGSGPFGSSLFASNWLAGRERASTMQSIRSSDAPSSPRESPADNDVRTLDYLGLVDSPNPNRTSMSQAEIEALMNQRSGATIADLAALNAFNNKNTANRFRSYSVNAKEKYADGDDGSIDQYDVAAQMYASGQLTPSAEATAAQAAAIHEAVRQHNLEVQAFANFASANRPRARTAGVLDSPSTRVLRGYMPTPSRLDNSISAADLQTDDGSEYNGLAASMQTLAVNANAGLDPMEAPTRALWLGNIPSSATVSSLNVIFGQFGSIEFARILTHKSCGFVNYDNLQSAIAAKTACNGKEIFPGCGPVRIGFAKEQSTGNTPAANGTYPSPSPDPFISTRNDSTTSGAVFRADNINAETAAAALATPNLLELTEEINTIVQQFGASPEEQTRMAQTLDMAMSYTGFMPEIPPIPEPSHNRIHDAPRLREIRKRIDNNSCSPSELENIAMDMLPEIAELASDYLGNTVVQKLFEHCSEETKETMLSHIAPYLAEIGVHKNGTWAAQKIIDVARTTTQMELIVNAVQPHAVNLFLDQYGNYVMQCCLRFQHPLNDFIFNSMLSRLWDLAQGRFGARAMRACLESHFATNDQKRLMAAAIALHSVQLATNSNGALLLTWFLDTCTFPRRRSVLAPHLIPHLVHLCTHKVAYLTVLKIINQRNEPEARDSILRALFFEDQTLTDIVSEQSCGATLIFKVLTTPFLDESIRPECIENVRNVLVRIKAQPTQGYKRLMDEVGLSTRHGGGPDNRSGSKSRNGVDIAAQNGLGRQSFGTPQQHLDPNMQRSVSIDSNGFDPYGITPQYTHSPAMSNNGISPLQYQQAMMAQSQRPPGFYGSPGATHGNGMQGGSVFGAGSPAPPQMMDPYRQNPNLLNPAMNMQGGYQSQGFGSPMGGMNGYGQYQMPPQFFGQVQGQMGGQQRRSRHR